MESSNAYSKQCYIQKLIIIIMLKKSIVKLTNSYNFVRTIPRVLLEIQLDQNRKSQKLEFVPMLHGFQY